MHHGHLGLDQVSVMRNREVSLIRRSSKYFIVKIRLFGELFKIYTRVLRGVIYTLRSKVSMATKALHPGGC